MTAKPLCFSSDRPRPRSNGGSVCRVHQTASGQAGRRHRQLWLRGCAGPHAAHHAGHLEQALPGDPPEWYWSLNCHAFCQLLNRAHGDSALQQSAALHAALG